MPATADGVIQQNSGVASTNVTSATVSLPSGTTAGNTLFVITSSQLLVLTPSGWAADKAFGYLRVFRKSNISAGETSWVFSVGGTPTEAITWWVIERDDIDLVEPVDVHANAGPPKGALTNGGTLSTSTTALNAGLSTWILGVYSASQPDAADVQSWGSYTNSFTEVLDLAPNVTNGVQLAIAEKYVDGTTGTFETTATFTTDSAGAPLGGSFVLVYRAAGSGIAAPLGGFYGFEWGTHGGMGQAHNALGGGVGGLGDYTTGAQGTAGTNYQVGAGFARNSTAGLRVTQTGAGNQYVPVLNLLNPAGCHGMNVRVVSATGTVVVMEVPTLDEYLQLIYDEPTSKFGLRWGASGTPSWQSGTTALNTWVWVEDRLKISSSTWHADWRIETATDTYTDQTSPTDPTGNTTGSTLAQINLGGATSQTATFDFDDVIGSKYYVAYPLGPHQVTLLTVDSSDTSSLSGTAGNFNVFTNNGTLVAWNAANARDALDEVPPEVSSSADGVAQVTTAASDYMQFPMQTYTCAYDEAIAGVRMLAVAWGGAGGTTGNLDIYGYDGSVSTRLHGGGYYFASNPAAVSATEPKWVHAYWPSGVGWTQAELDAAALRVGFSLDATPDMGVSALYLEVAVKKITPVRMLSVEDDVFTVDLYVHPYTSASVSYVITNNDATRTAAFSYSISGVPQTPITISPGTSDTVQLNADAFGDVSDVTLGEA